MSFWYAPGCAPTGGTPTRACIGRPWPWSGRRPRPGRRRLQETLTPEEQEVYRRGRNTQVHSVPKGADLADYHAATGLEALFGWLYLTGQGERLETLFRLSLEEVRGHAT